MDEFLKTTMKMAKDTSIDGGRFDGQILISGRAILLRIGGAQILLVELAHGVFSRRRRGRAQQYPAQARVRCWGVGLIGSPAKGQVQMPSPGKADA
jgi:hypothetical protein